MKFQIKGREKPVKLVELRDDDEDISLYVDGRLIAWISDDTFYVNASEAAFKQAGLIRDRWSPA